MGWASVPADDVRASSPAPPMQSEYIFSGSLVGVALEPAHYEDLRIFEMASHLAHVAPPSPQKGESIWEYFEEIPRVARDIANF
jgi:hypothetical protein